MVGLSNPQLAPDPYDSKRNVASAQDKRTSGPHRTMKIDHTTGDYRPLLVWEYTYEGGERNE